MSIDMGEPSGLSHGGFKPVYVLACNLKIPKLQTWQSLPKPLRKIRSG